MKNKYLIIITVLLLLGCSDNENSKLTENIPTIDKTNPDSLTTNTSDLHIETNLQAQNEAIRDLIGIDVNNIIFNQIDTLDFEIAKENNTDRVITGLDLNIRIINADGIVLVESDIEDAMGLTDTPFEPKYRTIEQHQVILDPNNSIDKQIFDILTSKSEGLVADVTIRAISFKDYPTITF